MPTFDEDTINMIKQIDPITVVIVICLLIAVVTKYKVQIGEFITTYVIGKLKRQKDESESQESSEEHSCGLQDVLVSLNEIKSDIQFMKDHQESIIEEQSSLHMELETLHNNMMESHDELTSSIDHIASTNEFLLNSDKEDKKAFITREYNWYYVRMKKIDLYSKETIEKIYELYLKENGDTFVAGMMTAIRSLPVVPTITQEDIEMMNMNSKHPNGSTNQQVSS